MAIKQLELQKTLYKVGDFLEWESSKLLDLSPPFQRRSVWKKPTKSFLIDSILRGLPIPIIFLREKTDVDKMRTIRQVVDGQQRLRTIFSFVDPGLLKDFDSELDEFTIIKSHNKELAGKQFSKLDKNLRQRILDYQFSVHILPSDTSDRDVLEIFRRLNSTGTPLSAQELINAEFSGAFATYVAGAALQQLERWVEWVVFSELEISRMKEVELTADLFILMLNGVSGRSKTVLKKYYGDYDNEFVNGEILIKRFQEVIDAIDDQIGDLISGLTIGRKGLFYVTFAAFYDAMYGIDSNITKVRPKRIPADFKKRIRRLDTSITNINVPENVERALVKQTTHVSTRKTLVKYFISRLKNA